MTEPTVRLPSDKWQQVIDFLAEQPFRVVAGLITEIIRQVQTQTGAQPMSGNGQADQPHVSDR